MVGLYYVIQEMGIFPMSVANNFCDMPLPKYIDSKTVLIYRPHPVQKHAKASRTILIELIAVSSIILYICMDDVSVCDMLTTKILYHQFSPTGILYEYLAAPQKRKNIHVLGQAFATRDYTVRGQTCVWRLPKY